jgi:hypothetical protein
MCIILTIEGGMSKTKWCYHIIILIIELNEKERGREEKNVREQRKGDKIRL